MSSSHESDLYNTVKPGHLSESSNTPEPSHLGPKHVPPEPPTVPEIKIETGEEEKDVSTKEIESESLEAENKIGAAVPQAESMSERHEASMQLDTAEKQADVSTPAQEISKQLEPQTPKGSSAASATPSYIVEKETTSPEPPPPPPKDDKFVPTTKKPETDPEKEALKSEDTEYDVGANDEHEESGEVFDDEQSEIASIMEQFQDDEAAPGEAEIMSPRLEIGQPFFGSPGQHPPRKSSLEPIRTGSPDSLRKSLTLHSPPPRTSSLGPSSPVLSLKRQSIPYDEIGSPLAPETSKSLPPPPQPDPEPDLPFDFHRFLEQLRHKSADPVAKYLRSFLLEFGKKPWMVHEQVKIISDFLEFITKKMAQSEVWRTVSDPEFDNAREGMEKLVMNRLYTHTFSPSIPPLAPTRASSKGKRRTDTQSSSTQVGRRGQHQEDVERDEVLAQKVRIYGWVKEEHLDIAPIGEKGKKFMSLAQAGSLQSLLFEVALIKMHRALENQKLSSSTRQGHLHTKLLQGDLWCVLAYCYLKNRTDIRKVSYETHSTINQPTLLYPYSSTLCFMQILNI